MKSIRWSLVTYFLLLALAALGAATWVVHRTAAHAVMAEHETNRKLLLTQHEEQKQEARAKLDMELLSQARTLASLARSQTQWLRAEFTQFMPLGVLTSTLAPQGHMLVPFWVATSHRPVNRVLFGPLIRDIVVEEDQLLRDFQFTSLEYFQINSEWGSVWHSRSLADKSLPFDSAKIAKDQVVVEKFDDVELPSGQIGRRVIAKYPIVRYRSIREGPFLTPERPFAPPGPGGRIPGAPRGPGRPVERVTDTSIPWFVVQCACDTERRDAQIARLSSMLATQSNDLEAKADKALLQLRTRLVLIGLATFIATALGGFLIVNVGLSPLRRLSDAVSRVTAKDFHLQFDDDRRPTELEPIVDRLRGTLGQLRIAFEREKQAVADISHELRTPVTALLATLDVVLRKVRTAEEYRHALEEARNVGGHLRHLVERLLALARIDAGVARVEPRPVVVADLVNKTLSLIRPLAIPKNLRLESNVPPDLDWLTDADKVHDILVNLLHNAVQYNRQDGSITVSARVTDNHLELSVTDTGIGMSPETQEQIFERFYRADLAREEAALHAGLGLSIVRGYAELLQGTVEVRSTLDVGTVFTVRLPALTPVPARPAATERLPRGGAGQEKSAGRALVEV